MAKRVYQSTIYVNRDMGYLFCLIDFAFLHLPRGTSETKYRRTSAVYLGDSLDILRLRSERTLSRTAGTSETDAVGGIDQRTRGRQAVSDVEILANGECPREAHCQTNMESC